MDIYNAATISSFVVLIHCSIKRSYAGKKALKEKLGHPMI